MISSNQTPLLSLVITSYTTERLNDIYELISSIKIQTYKNMETIFVVERSNELQDKINAFIADNSVTTLTVVFSNEKLGLSAARNLGIKNAKGDIIAFVDDDVVLFPDWAEEMVKSYGNALTIGVTGNGYPLWEDNNMKWLPDQFYWIVSCTAFTNWKQARSVRSAWGMNMSFLREAFEISMFSPNFGQTNGGKEAWKTGPVDDAEFSINLRIKTKKDILYNPKVQVYHKVYKYRLSSKFIRGQSYWQGFSKALLKKMYPEDEDTKTLVRERDVLQRILFRVVPQSFIGIFSKPSLSIKKLYLTFYVLSFVALGYSAGTCPRLFGFTKRYFES
jgi:glycosyltransferase involved in cell wall biosynthesis